VTGPDRFSDPLRLLAGKRSQQELVSVRLDHTTHVLAGIANAHRLGRRVDERDGHYHIGLDSDDVLTRLDVVGRACSGLPATSVFRSLQEASDFFERGSLGWSVTKQAGEFDGLELRSFNWQVTPLAVERVTSSFFDDQTLFRPGSAEIDSALLMKGIDHEWYNRGRLCLVGGGIPVAV